MITTSLYAVYAGAATVAVGTGETLTRTAGAALAVYLAGRWVVHSRSLRRGSLAAPVPGPRA